MVYTKRQNMLDVTELPETSDETRCLQLQYNVNNEWINRSCIYEDTNTKGMPVEDGVDMIRGMYCVEGVCGESSRATGQYKNYRCPIV